MKMRLGNVLIETNHIERVERVSTYTVKVFFVSGNVLEVHCGIKSSARAIWDQDADGFIQTIHNTDAVKVFDKEST